MGGRLADSPAQAHWDVELPDGARVQVKCLVNTATHGQTAWLNEHVVRSLPGIVWYALVIIESFYVSGAVAFPAELGATCRALGKRHGEQETTLQFVGATA